MFRINVVGLGMLLAAAVVGGGLSALGVPSRWAGSAGAAVLVAADLIWRWRQPAAGRDKWLAGHAGGFLALGPVWIIGLVLIGFAQAGLLE